MNREEVLHVLREESAFRAKFKQRVRGVLVGIVGLSVVSSLYLALTKGDWSSMASMLIFLAIGGVGAGFRPAHRAALKEVANRADPEVAAYLCEMLDTQEVDLIPLIHESLLIALPHVSEEEAKCFTAEQKKAMTDYLMRSNNANLSEVIVSCLGRIGSLPEIASLVTMRMSPNAHLSSSDRVRIDNRAQMALADIRMREARLRIEATEVKSILPAEVRDYAAEREVKVEN